MTNRTVLIVFSILLFASLCFSEGARYLIITPDSYYDAILPLAEWKTKKGMKAKIAKLSETGSSSAQIRSYIITAYNTWTPRPEYLLIVGDDNAIDMPSHGGATSDNYYTDIEGDLYNEIIPGRFPAQYVSQVNTMVSKTLGYERTPYLEDSLWFRKGTSIVNGDGGSGDSVYWNDAYHAIALMTAAGYVVIDTFSDTGGDNADDVENAVTEGRTFVQYRGQGVSNWWSPFGIDPNSMNCGFKLPVVVSATCATYSGIGYTLLRAGTASNPKGAVGCAATSTVCSGLACAQRRSALARGFANGMFRGAGILGLACEDGRKNVYRIHGNVAEYNGFICLGDPELNLWTGTPEILCVTHPDVVNLGLTEVTVNVRKNVGLLPIPNAQVCLMMDTTVYEYAYTNGQGNVTFLVNTQHIGDMSVTVTVTTRDYLPYEGNISVLPMGPYLVCLTSTFTDSIEGNNDGVINPGEEIYFNVLVKNEGSETAESVYADISVDNSYITLLDSTILFNDIPPDSETWGVEGVTFFVAPDCSPGYPIDCSLSMYDAEGDSWEISLPYLYVNTGILDWDGVIVYDTLPGGDGDGIADPNEAIQLYVSVKNIGQSDLYGAEATLRSNSEFIIICDSLMSFENIPVDSATLSLNPVEILVSPAAVPGYDIPFELYTVEEGSTYTHYDTILFSLDVGEGGTSIPTGPDDYGYYCYDNTDTICDIVPVYDWYEIAPPGPGSIITAITDEDARTTTISLPFDFKYYGNEFTTISICSNGFLAMGYTAYRFGYNSAIPDTQGPANMIAPFWCDLDPSEYGDIYQYYDETNHRWMCEFEECAHYDAPTVRETFQAILLDPQYYPTRTGDGEIIFQYANVANLSTSTVGIENGSEDIGIQYYYNYNYDPAAAPIQNGRAIKFSTEPPVSFSPWIFFYDYAVVDSTGNNDSIPNPGEDFKLYIYFENLGNTTAYSLSTRLSILDSLITTDDSVSSFGDIPAGEVVGNESDPYVMSILPQYDDSTACFYLHVESNGGDYTTLIPLQIEVGPPITGIEGKGNYVFGLSQNYPNPMSRTACIDFQTSRDCEVRVDVYNVAGMHIKTLVDNDLKAGRHSVVWDGSDDDDRSVPGGIYFYKIEAGSKTMTRKLVKVR